MLKRALLLAIPAVFSLPSQAQAQACGDYPVSVKVQCKAELLALSGVTKRLEAQTPKTRLAMAAVGSQATIAMGAHWVSAGLVCQKGRGDPAMSYRLEVRLSQKGRPHASPLHLASLSNLGLDERSGKPPLKLESYFFFAS